MPDHKILGFSIRHKVTTQIAGILFIILGLLITTMGVVYFLGGLESRMATDGSDLYSSVRIIYVDHPSSPLLYFCGVMTIAGGLILLNNACKLLLNRSYLHALLTRSILSSVLLFLLIGLQTAVFFGMHSGRVLALDLRPVIMLGIVFFVVVLVFFIIKKIYRNKLIRTYWATLPVFVIIVCLVAAVGIISKIRYHTDPDKAARAFALTNYEIKNSANFLFAESDDHRVDVAKLTPDLMRALIRHNVRIPYDPFAGRRGISLQLSGVNTELQNLVKIDEVPQVPMPGWTPMIILLLAMIAFIALRRLKNSWAYLAKPENMVGIFGWTNLFLLYWFGVASAGGLYNIYLAGKLTNPEGASIADAGNIVNGGMLLGFICAVVLISTTRSRLRSSLPADVKKGWIIFFYFVNLFALAGVYALSHKNSATPVLPWLFVYNLLSALSYWTAIYFQKQPV